MKRQSGFTLIELLLVLAIIGIISAIAIPALMGQKERANQKATEGTAQSVVSECAAGAKLMNTAGTAGVMTYVTSMPNFIFPRCKNPYKQTTSSVNGTTGATAAGAASALGEVGMVAGSQLDINGVSVNTIAITYWHGAALSATPMSNVPVE